MKELENKIEVITGSKKFKITSKTYYHPIKNIFSDLLSNIVEVKKTKNNLDNYQTLLKIRFLCLIEELCNNNKFYKLVDDDIPCLKSILDYFEKLNNKDDMIEDLKDFIEKWIDDLEIRNNDDIFYLLNEQFKKYYKLKIGE